MTKKHFTYRGSIVAWLFMAALMTGSLSAKDIFISQNGGAGTNTVAWLNVATNWNDVTIAPGDVVNLVGIITNKIQVQGSGTVLKPITLKFAPGSLLTAPTWNTNRSGFVQSSAAIWGNSFHDVIIDGAIINCTSNGNTRLMFTNQNVGIYFQNCQNLEIKNCIITNLSVDIVSTNAVLNPLWDGVHNGGNYEPKWQFKYPTAGGNGIYIAGQNLTNISVHNNFVDWSGNGILLSMDTGYHANIQLYSNTVFHCSWGLGWLQSAANTICKDSSIWANWVANQTNYDGNPNADAAGNPNHQDGMIVSCNTPSGYNTNMKIYRNKFGPSIGVLSSAYLYQETNFHATNWQGLAICDNVFLAQDINDHPTGIMIINGDAIKVFNNTIISSVTTGNDGWPLFRPVSTGRLTGIIANSSGARAFFWTNNLVVNCGYAVGALGQVDQAPSADYNAYFWPFNILSTFDVNAENGLQFGTVPGSNAHATFSNWQTMRCDIHGFATTAAARLNSEGIPFPNSLIARAGVNLTSMYAALGIPPVDFAGNPRPATDPWTIGAYEVARATNSMVPPFLKTITPR